jgi:hypothetical protein
MIYYQGGHRGPPLRFKIFVLFPIGGIVHYVFAYAVQIGFVAGGSAESFLKIFLRGLTLLFSSLYFQSPDNW